MRNKIKKGELIKVVPSNFHGTICDIPFIIEGQELPKPSLHIISKVKKKKNFTIITIRPIPNPKEKIQSL